VKGSTTEGPLPRPVRIRYQRPPHREHVFDQTLVHEGDDGLVTFLEEAGVTTPTVVGGRVALEARSPVVWFTFPGAWHDIGRFHSPDGEFTGFYANVLTPVERLGIEEGAEVWRTTDLFLDVVLTPDGRVHVLDRDELEEALHRGWIDSDRARAAEREADRLVRAALNGEWPPPIVHAWTLERTRAAALRDR
jgi:predicted RNA-binding protein associated with RNAse of E/G family